jgi:hypothetical protein
MTLQKMTSHVDSDILVGAKHTNRTQGTGIFVVNLIKIRFQTLNYERKIRRRNILCLETDFM